MPLVRRRRDRGIVLLLVMLILMVLSVVVLQLAFSAEVAQRAASNLSRDLQNMKALTSGLAIARLMIKADIEGDLAEAPTPPLDHLGESLMQDIEPYRFNDGGTDVTSLYLKIEDEEGKFYLPALVDENGAVVEDQKERLARMLEYAGIGDADTPERIAAAMDKTDQNAFDKDVPNRKFYTLKELLGVPGITDEMYYGKTVGSEKHFGLADLLSLYGSGRVNVNTAPRPVLMSLSTSIGASDVDGIVSARESSDSEGNPEVFQNTSYDQLSRSGMTEETHQSIASRIVVRSSWFRARMLARTGSVQRWGAAVIQRVQAATVLVLWEDDLRFAPDPDDLKVQDEAEAK
ncbi:MAG: general secretion pathway protein GspK [Planctomycetia bacterium]|nr:general secretion pathway protein GspK [Planctomycetia bacterium]